MSLPHWSAWTYKIHFSSGETAIFEGAILNPCEKDSVPWRASKAEAATVALRTDLNHTRGGGRS